MNVFALRENHRTDNLGDRLIMRNMVQALSSHGRVLAYDPTPFLPALQRYEPLVHSSRWRRMAARLAGDAHYVADPAGGFGRVSPVASSRSNTTAPRFAFLNGLRKQLLPRRIALGLSISISPDDARFDNHAWIGVRDSESLASLRARGLKQAGYFPDWAFFDPYHVSEDHSVPSVAISLRRSGPDHPGELSSSVLGSPLDALARRFGTVCFFHQVAEDAAFSTTLHQVFPQTSLHDHPLSAETYQSFYRRHPVVASNRLHCLLFGAMNGALPVALVPDATGKIVSLYATLRWEELIVRLDQDAPQQIEKIATNRSRLARMVEASCRNQRRQGDRELAAHFGRARAT